MGWSKLPIWFRRATIIAVVLSWLPLALIARARVVRSDRPRVHIVQDMDNQVKLTTQELNPLFADRRAMRPKVPGTVARGQLMDDDHYYRGKVGDDWAVGYPPRVRISGEFVRRGRERFDIFCAPCHGYDGSGNGPIHQRAVEKQESLWVPPTALVSDTVRERVEGHLFNSITHGIRNMPGYAAQIDVEDRWAIIAYLRAMQLSRRATLDDVPADKRDTLR